MAAGVIKPVNHELICKNSSEASLRSFGKLPNELISHIASFLNPKDQQSLASTDKRLSECVVVSACESELTGLKKFLNNLIGRLESVPNEGVKGRLNAILSDIFPKMKLETLIHIKTHLIQKKRLITQVLKELDFATLNQLKSDLATPYFLEHIFKLASLEKELEAARWLPNIFDRVVQLGRISNDIALAGDVDRALEIDDLYNTSRDRRSRWAQMVDALVACGSFNGAIKVARAFSLREGFTQYNMIEAIAVGIARSGDISKALELLSEIDKPHLREDPLRDICKILSEKSDVKKALEIAQIICDERSKGDQPESIVCDYLTQAGHLEQALLLANNLPEQCLTRSKTFLAAARDFFQKGNIEEAGKMISSIPMSFESYHFEQLFYEVTTSENYHKAQELALLIPQSPRRDEALSGIAASLVRYQILDRALSTVKMISCMKIKMNIYSVISECFIYARNDIDRGAKILLLISDRSMRQSALNEICEHLSTCNRKKDALCLKALMLRNEHRMLIGMFNLVLLSICVSYFYKFLENKE